MSLYIEHNYLIEIDIEESKNRKCINGVCYCLGYLFIFKLISHFYKKNVWDFLPFFKVKRRFLIFVNLSLCNGIITFKLNYYVISTIMIDIQQDGYQKSTSNSIIIIKLVLSKTEINFY